MAKFARVQLKVGHWEVEGGATSRSYTTESAIIRLDTVVLWNVDSGIIELEGGRTEVVAAECRAAFDAEFNAWVKEQNA